MTCKHIIIIFSSRAALTLPIDSTSFSFPSACCTSLLIKHSLNEIEWICSPQNQPPTKIIKDQQSTATSAPQTVTTLWFLLSRIDVRFQHWFHHKTYRPNVRCYSTYQNFKLLWWRDALGVNNTQQPTNSGVDSNWTRNSQAKARLLVFPHWARARWI